jgi:regulator of sirC expression with transglutaminase-like and TPR domain
MLRYTELALVLQPDSGMDRFYRAVLYLQTDRLPQARADVEWLLANPPKELDRDAIDDLARAIARESRAGE